MQSRPDMAPILSTAISMDGLLRLRRTPPTDLQEEGRGLRPYRYSAMTMLCENVLPKKAAEDGMLNADRMAT